MPKPTRPSTSEGYDTAHKLSILATLCFGYEIAPDKIRVEGISKISQHDIKVAAELGYKIKLLGIAQRTEDGIEQRVHPTFVPKGSAIAGVDGVMNAVALRNRPRARASAGRPRRRWPAHGLLGAVGHSRHCPRHLRAAARRAQR
ncbi:hypothetical protein N8D56_19070 [Devosia sp. A8/3-2]|nr:hypothetical protein N8D56_19070 [Devosia sp. A8/3-2]